MDSLINYVKDMLAKGYSEEQIRQALVNNNYPSSMIDAAFKEASNPNSVQETPVQTQATPVQQTQNSQALNRAPPQDTVNQLVTYMNQYLSQGYQIEQLKTFLQQQGYSSNDVQKAASIINKPQTIKHEVHLPFATIFGIVLIIGFVFGGYFLMNNFFSNSNPDLPSNIQIPTDPTTQYLLDVSTTLSEQTVIQGDKLTISTLVVNMGSSEKYDITLKYELLNAFGKNQYLNIPTQTKALSSTLEVDKTIDIPENLQPGIYEVKVTALYEGKEAYSQAKFKIIVKSSTNDLNKEDDYQEIEQQYYTPEIIIIAENTDSEDLMQEVVDLAKEGSTTEAEAKCLALSNNIQKDNCLSTLAVYDNEASHCSKIIDDKEHDNCLMSIMMAKGYDNCDSFKTKDKKELCIRLKSLSELSAAQSSQPDDYQEFDVNDFTN